MYNPKSLKAEEFISDEEIRECVLRLPHDDESALVADALNVLDAVTSFPFSWYAFPVALSISVPWSV